MPRKIGEVTVNGALVEVLVGMARSELLALSEGERSKHSLLRVKALIDTGASVSGIDSGIAQELGLVPAGVEEIRTASTTAAPHYCCSYVIHLRLDDDQSPLNLWDLTVFEAEFEGQGFEILLGRDVLEQCLLVWDGAGAAFILTF